MNAFSPNKRKIIFSLWIAILFAALFYLSASEMNTEMQKALNSAGWAAAAFIAAYIIHSLGSMIKKKFQ